MPAARASTHIRECRRRARLEIDNLADQRGAAQVRRHQAQAPEGVFVSKTVAFMSKDIEGTETCCRLSRMAKALSIQP